MGCENIERVSYALDSHHIVGRSRIVSMFPTRRPRSRLLEMVERCSACVRKASCGIVRRYSAGKHRIG